MAAMLWLYFDSKSVHIVWFDELCWNGIILVVVIDVEVVVVVVFVVVITE